MKGVFQMKRDLTLFPLIVLLIQVGCVFGKGAVMPQEANMPEEIVQCKSLAEVAPFLSGNDEMLRRWAVVRIGEFGAKDAVPKLISTFAKEPRKLGIDVNPIVRQEVIRTLANTGGKEAKMFLLSTLQKYVKEGPRAKRYAWEDNEYCTIILTTLTELGRWEDDDISNIFERTYLNDRLFWHIRQKAYEQHLAVKMKAENIVGLEDHARYLLKNIKSRGTGHSSDWKKGRNGVKTKTLEAIKNGAMVKMLIQYDESVLPYVHEELNTLSPGKDNRRYEAIEYIKQRIEISIKNRKQKEKQNKKQKQK